MGNDDGDEPREGPRGGQPCGEINRGGNKGRHIFVEGRNQNPGLPLVPLWSDELKECSSLVNEWLKQSQIGPFTSL